MCCIGISRGKAGLKIRYFANTGINILKSPASSVLRNGLPRAEAGSMRDDIQTRIEKLKREIEEASNEKPLFGTATDCPPEVEEAFLRQVLSCELAEKKRRERRHRRG